MQASSSVSIWRISAEEPNGKLLGTGNDADGAVRRYAREVDAATGRDGRVSAADVDAYVAKSAPGSAALSRALKDEIAAAQTRSVALDAAMVALRPVSAAAHLVIGALFWSR